VESDHRIVVERWQVVALVVLGLGYAVLASSTRPFTWAANVVTAVPLGVAVVVTVWSSRDASRPAVVPRADSEAAVAAQWGRGWIAWVAPILAIAGWELYCFATLPRAEHPTLSSLIDILDSTRAGKILAFGSWLVLGWFLVVS
jgi:hypothetical protein